MRRRNEKRHQPRRRKLLVTLLLASVVLFGTLYMASNHGSIGSSGIQSRIGRSVVASQKDWREETRSIPFTIATGASAGYFGGLTNFVGSVQYWCPTCRIVIYNLGLTQAQLSQMNATWCGHSIEWEDGSRSPDLRQYAWKPQAILHAVEKYGVMVWLDAGCSLTGPVGEVEAQIRRDGVWNVQGQDGNMVRYVHPGSFAYFNLSSSLFENRPSFAGGLWGFARGAPAVDIILKPWVACSKIPACIAPPGSGLGNHRFDQAVVSIITYTSATTLKPDGTELFPRICPPYTNGTHCEGPQLNVTPRTDLLAYSSHQLENGGCYKASKMVIWTARQGCSCYAKDVTNCSLLAYDPRKEKLG